MLNVFFLCNPSSSPTLNMDLPGVTNMSSISNQSLPQECLSNEVFFISLIPDRQQSDLFYTTGQTLLILVLCPLVAAFGMFGNTAFLVVLTYVREMHTITNFYLGNLAISDFMMLLLSSIRYFRQFYGSHGFVKAENIDSSVWCTLDKAVPHVFFFSSVGFVTLVSLERFFAVCYPIKYRNANSKARAIKYVTLTWILAIITTGVIAPTWSKVTRFCVVWNTHERNESVTVYSYCDAAGPAFSKLHALIEIVYFFVTFGISATCYIMILTHLKKRQIPGASKVIQLQAKTTRNQVARMVILNGLVFFLCLVPFQIYNIIIYSNSTILAKNEGVNLVWAARLLEGVNSSVNPIIYTAANSKYQRAFHQTFLQRCINSNNKRHKVPTISKFRETRL